DEPGSSTVLYWPQNSTQMVQATGHITTYTYYNYTSGYIHHCTLEDLESNTTYYYEIGFGHTTRTFWFVTPPEVGPDVPYTFGIIDHYPYHDNRRWDSWGRFVERSVAYQPWIWTAGNHELDFSPSIGEIEPFKPFLHRYHVPFEASGSTEPLWYSIKRASAYIIVLSSYSAYGTYTPQYMWLMEELPKVNRSETPWLIVLMHSPWYNSNTYHYMEGETMRVMFESSFVQYKVDVVFAGHVHAYERSERISNIAYNIVNGECTPVHDENAPVYITIGDGGNIEGLASSMTEPQPKYSAFREASFGHATMEIKNRTHAYYSWHRNVDGYAVKSDSVVFSNRYWRPKNNDSTIHT
nr:purple acid phosphatase 2-like [Tanacetum cinerariifolium]